PIAALGLPVFNAASAASSLTSAYRRIRSLLADPPEPPLRSFDPSGLLYFWKIRPDNPSDGFKNTLIRGSVPCAFKSFSVIRYLVLVASLKSPAPRTSMECPLNTLIFSTPRQAPSCARFRLLLPLLGMAA